ncbi:hypothetical protein [Bradyrhizobium sp. USDA 336]|uniref:hypothetical protein n=1 Tax=Bradyrhizobium sp. USDA 336 TaxID=3156311 RepID=UPI0038382289
MAAHVLRQFRNTSGEARGVGFIPVADALREAAGEPARVHDEILQTDPGDEKLSIAALFQTLPDRLMLQPILSAISRWNCSLVYCAY